MSADKQVCSLRFTLNSALTLTVLVKPESHLPAVPSTDPVSPELLGRPSDLKVLISKVPPLTKHLAHSARTESASQEAHSDNFNPRVLWYFPGYPNDRPLIQNTYITLEGPGSYTLLCEQSSFSNCMNVLSDKLLLPAPGAARIQHRPQTNGETHVFSIPFTLTQFCFYTLWGGIRCNKGGSTVQCKAD